MSMTTTRVTVPVEDLLFYKLKDLILEQSEGEWTDEMIVRDAHHFANHIRPLLSAAPAPEGGAVSDLRRLLENAICYGCSRRYGDNSDAAIKDARGCVSCKAARAALATREEAPAEAEEMEWRVDYNAVVGVSAYLQNQRLFDSAKAVERMLSRAAAYRNCRDAHAELAALRAQPQAREEAQPVAWSLDFGMGVNAQTTFSTEGKAEHYAKDCPKPSPSVVPLYTTPPAPEAEKMRVAVEALEFYRDKVSILAAPKERALFDDKGLRATQALAALQQEGVK